MTTSKLYEDDDALVTFDSLLNGIREHIDRIHYLCSVVHKLQPNSILDVGCHFGLLGSLFRWNHQAQKRIVGVDWSTTSADLARRFGYDSVILQNAEEFRAHEQFELVMCTELLEHVVEPQALVRRCVAHSTKYVLFSTPVESEKVDGEFHIRHVRPGELVDWVQGVGIDVLEATLLKSEFCEKPHWMGWTVVLGEVR